MLITHAELQLVLSINLQYHPLRTLAQSWKVTPSSSRSANLKKDDRLKAAFTFDSLQSNTASF